MKRFVDNNDIVVREKRKIGGYLKDSAGVEVRSINEVAPGVLEYSFIERRSYRPFEDTWKLCKFIFVVDKSSGAIIDWRYNGKPEYCYSGNT